jgi:molybdenum cofactor cytidylyltransferase
VHRPDVFSAICGIPLGQPITLSGMAAVLRHEQGGIKNIPGSAWRVLLLNQADTPEAQSQARGLADRLIPPYHKVLVASLGSGIRERNQKTVTQGLVHAVVTPVAGVILAAGGSLRMGKPKQLLDWKGETLVHHVAQIAINAGLTPVNVVTGAYKEEVDRQLAGLSVQPVYNPDWSQGMSTSIHAGMGRLPAATGAVIFLLVDQPQIQAGLLRALIETHRRTLAKIIAPIIEGDRGNPVLFDRTTFEDLMRLKGDVGGRALFSKYPITYLPWLDADMRLDVDTPLDYQRLLDLE